MLYQLNQLQLHPQLFLISTWVLLTLASVASTSLAAPPLPTTTHVPHVERTQYDKILLIHVL
jgi:hypothetical protein